MEPSIHAPSLVSRNDSEALLDAVSQGTADPLAGVFGPQSMSWRINREAALFLGAGRAALLQLAHPWVTASLEQHSNVMSRPIARFHNTFRVVFAMIFGSLHQAVGAARHLYTVHTYIRGEMKETIVAYPRGSHYEANEIAALRWVYATLIESAVLAYECAMPPLTPSELATYFKETHTLASLFGLLPSELPANWNEFLDYRREMETSSLLGVTANARTMAHGLLRGAHSWIKPPYWYRALTTEWLPARFRDEFGLDFGADEQKAADRAKQRLPQIYRRLPPIIRFVGPWHEAQARLRAKSPGVVTKLSNRFWIGQARLPFA
jgi:uncharacterized protein (DUF2236 family)